MFTLKAGKYYIGDPCYVLHSSVKYPDFWEDFCSTLDCHDGNIIDHFGYKYATFGTKYGDGCYDDGFGNSYGVDAGIIGCIPIEMIEDVSEYEITDGKLHINYEKSTVDGNDSYFLGKIFTFDYDFHCEDDNGLLIFGDVEIQTGDYEIDDDSVDEY